MCSKLIIPFLWKTQQNAYNSQNSQRNNKQLCIYTDRWIMKVPLNFGDLNVTLRYVIRITDIHPLLYRLQMLRRYNTCTAHLQSVPDKDVESPALRHCCVTIRTISSSPPSYITVCASVHVRCVLLYYSILH